MNHESNLYIDVLSLDHDVIYCINSLRLLRHLKNNPPPTLSIEYIFIVYYFLTEGINYLNNYQTKKR